VIASLGLRLLAGAIALAALAGLYAWWAGVQRDVGRSEVRAEWAEVRERQKDAALRQAAENAAETERRLKAQKEAQDAHAQDLARARADAASAAGAADRLRKRVAELAAADRGTPRDPAATGNGPPAGSTASLFADVLGRVDEALRTTGAFADASRAAGEQCVRSYEALTAAP
jgi:hypothetical protein